ncbi:MAG: hypothetical protein RBT20_07870 [Syntrophales bacterium]|nr:hypothetical protein [Syntrophales bacterium]
MDRDMVSQDQFEEVKKSEYRKELHKLLDDYMDRHRYAYLAYEPEKTPEDWNREKYEAVINGLETVADMLRHRIFYLQDSLGIFSPPPKSIKQELERIRTEFEKMINSGRWELFLRSMVEKAPKKEKTAGKMRLVVDRHNRRLPEPTMRDGVVSATYKKWEREEKGEK